MSKNIQSQINQIKNSIINKDLTNTSMATYGKLNEIGHSLYRYDQLSKAGLKDEAKSESTKVNNLISNFNSSEDSEPLKGYISNTRYVWVAEDGACDECQDLDGTEYDSLDDVPASPHPNCQCRIEAIEDDDENNNDDDEPCDCYEIVSGWLDDCEELCGEYESALDDANSSIEELQSILDYIQNYTNAEIEEIQELQEKLNELITNAVSELMDVINQATSTIQIFWSNYEELKALKKELGYYLDQSAEYYHTKANCEAAQLGDVGAAMATFLGYLREFGDFPKEIIFKGGSIKKAFENSVHDLEVNAAGRKLGKEHPNEAPEVIIKPPDGLPPDYR